MSHKLYQIKIPDELMSSLDIENVSQLQIRQDNKRLVIEKPTAESRHEEKAIKWFFLPSILLTFIFFYIINQQSRMQIPFTGHESIATYVIYFGMLSGMISFTIFFIKEKKSADNEATRDIFWRNVPTIILAFTVTLALILAAFFWLMGNIFAGASFDRLTATFLFFMFISFVNYFMIYSAHIFNSDMIIPLLVAVIIGGVFFAMLTNTESQWWQYNFSFLGTNQAANSWPFNLTLILSALLMIALVDYLFVMLQNSGYKGLGVNILRLLLTFFAIALGGVGLFPNNGGTLHELHDRSASLLVTIMIILIIGMRWLLPKVTKEFLIVSYGIAILLVVSNFLFENVGYFSLTVFEIIAFGLAFSWILLLLQQINRLTLTNKQPVIIDLLEVIPTQEND